MTQSTPIKCVQLINCDWLQFYGHHIGLYPDVTDKGTNYLLKDVGMGTRVFRNVYEVYERPSVTKSHRKEKLATIACNPHSSVLDANLFVCKVENKVLYSSMPYVRIMAMIKQLSLQYLGITRLDVSVDFFKFVNDMHPLELLKLYRKNHLVKRGSRRYSQWLTAPYTPSKVIGIVDADMLSEEHVTHCVSWGTSNSDVHVKMYNKSKEIREESHKTYIQSWWRNNGLVGSGDVWRVEISVSRRSKCLYDNSSGEVVSIPLEWALQPTYLKEVFAALARRHFAWFSLEKGKRISREPNVELFDIKDCLVMKAATRQSIPDASRTAKVCANYLQRVVDDNDWDNLVRTPEYSKYTLIEASKTLSALYKGLKALSSSHKFMSDVEIERLKEHREWLSTWGILPDAIGGVSYGKVDDLITEAECRQKFLEELEVHRIEMRAAIENLAFENI